MIIHEPYTQDIAAGSWTDAQSYGVLRHRTTVHPSRRSEAGWEVGVGLCDDN
jgi:hypothetical protein